MPKPNDVQEFRSALNQFYEETKNQQKMNITSYDSWDHTYTSRTVGTLNSNQVERLNNAAISIEARVRDNTMSLEQGQESLKEIQEHRNNLIHGKGNFNDTYNALDKLKGGTADPSNELTEFRSKMEAFRRQNLSQEITSHEDDFNHETHYNGTLTDKDIDKLNHAASIIETRVNNNTLTLDQGTELLTALERNRDNLVQSNGAELSYGKDQSKANLEATQHTYQSLEELEECTTENYDPSIAEKNRSHQEKQAALSTFNDKLNSFQKEVYGDMADKSPRTLNNKDISILAQTAECIQLDVKNGSMSLEKGEELFGKVKQHYDSLQAMNSSLPAHQDKVNGDQKNAIYKELEDIQNQTDSRHNDPNLAYSHSDDVSFNFGEWDAIDSQMDEDEDEQVKKVDGQAKLENYDFFKKMQELMLVIMQILSSILGLDGLKSLTGKLNSHISSTKNESGMSTNNSIMDQQMTELMGSISNVISAASKMPGLSGLNSVSNTLNEQLKKPLTLDKATPGQDNQQPPVIAAASSSQEPAAKEAMSKLMKAFQSSSSPSPSGSESYSGLMSAIDSLNTKLKESKPAPSESAAPLSDNSSSVKPK